MPSWLQINQSEYSLGGIKVERLQPIVLFAIDLAKLNIVFPSAGFVCCFGEHARCAVACGYRFFGWIVSPESFKLPDTNIEKRVRSVL